MRAPVKRVISLYGKAGAAAATGGGVGVRHLERRTAQIFDIIDRRTAYQIEADRIDHQSHAIGLDRTILIIDYISKAKAILEAGAPASLNRKAQYGWLGLLVRDERDALCR